MKRAVAYYRVSTGRQGRSGLGLDAQRKSVQSFASANGFLLTEEFIETESGRRNGRLGLKAALKECRRQDAILLIAKLDRLSRSVAFISALMESEADFKVVDNPYAEKFTLHILAAVAQKECEDIRKRTTAALAAAKSRGVILGKYGRDVLSQQNKGEAERYALSLKPVITRIQNKGIQTVRAIVAELNRTGIPTFQKGGHWHINPVHRLLIRLRQVDKQ